MPFVSLGTVFYQSFYLHIYQTDIVNDFRFNLMPNPETTNLYCEGKFTTQELVNDTCNPFMSQEAFNLTQNRLNVFPPLFNVSIQMLSESTNMVFDLYSSDIVLWGSSCHTCREYGMQNSTEYVASNKSEFYTGLVFSWFNTSGYIVPEPETYRFNWTCAQT